MRYRKLRIAFSVGCGIVCVLLIVLWVRSYSVDQSLIIVRPNIALMQGRIYVGEIFLSTGAGITPANQSPGRLKPTPLGRGIVLPIYALVIIASASAAAPWVPKRFSLR